MNWKGFISQLGKSLGCLAIGLTIAGLFLPVTLPLVLGVVGAGFYYAILAWCENRKKTPPSWVSLGVSLWEKIFCLLRISLNSPFAKGGGGCSSASYSVALVSKAAWLARMVAWIISSIFHCMMEGRLDRDCLIRWSVRRSCGKL